MTRPTTTPSVLIRASAGTGKTYQLAHRYLALACADEPVDRILAVTFARKAAGEILERIVTRLADAVDNANVRREVSREIGRELSPQSCLRVLRDLASKLHRLRVGTLDSFFVQMARGFSLELGLPPGWQIVDEADEERLRSRAVQSIFQEIGSTADALALVRLLSKGDVARSVTQQIFSAVKEHYDTFLSTERDAWFGLARLPMLTEVKLAAAIERLTAIDPQSFGHAHTAKAHAKSLEVVDERDWEGFVVSGIAAKLVAGETTYNRKPITPEMESAYRPLVDHAAAHVRAQTANQTEATWKMLSHFDAAYRRHKLAARAVRFDDVARVLHAGLAAGRIGDVAHRLDGQIGHLLLDEFQDTSLAQWNVVRPLARAAVEQADRSLFCVGDVKQAIYGWRGGVAELFDAVREEFPSMAERPLDLSRRSSPAVIETVNRVFERIADNPALEEYPDVARAWQQRFRKHETALVNLAGYCKLEVAPEAAEGKKQEQSTLEFAAERVARAARAVPGRSIGVLVRTNPAVARLIYELRNKFDLRASEEGGNPLCDSPAVEVVLSALALADHPGDTVARFHIARSPLGTALGLTVYDDHCLAERCALDAREKLLADGYGRTIYRWARALAPHYDARDAGRLAQLVEMAYGYDERATLRADDFVFHVRQHRVADPTSANVRVMTVHQAKGLQFDVVVLPELYKKLVGRTPALVVDRRRAVDPIERVCRYVGEKLQPLFPGEYQRMFERWADPVVAESLCVLYVALTRAVHGLLMIVPPAQKKKDGEETLPKTFGGVLRAALAPGADATPGSVLFEHGQADWPRREARRAEPAEAAPASAEPLRVSLRTTGPTRRRSLDHESPSSLEGGTKVDLGKLLRLDASAAFARGTLVHKWLEQFAWLDDVRPTDETLWDLARQFAAPDLDPQAELARFAAMLDRPAVREVLSRAYYADPAKLGLAREACAQLASRSVRLEVQRERPLAVRLDEKLLSGTMDRLVILSHGELAVAADVIDFKTDAVAAGEVAARVDFYRPQVEAYRRGVSRLLHLAESHVTARLVFLEPGVVRSV